MTIWATHRLGISVWGIHFLMGKMVYGQHCPHWLTVFVPLPPLPSAAQPYSRCRSPRRHTYTYTHKPYMMGTGQKFRCNKSQVSFLRVVTVTRPFNVQKFLDGGREWLRPSLWKWWQEWGEAALLHHSSRRSLTPSCTSVLWGLPRTLLTVLTSGGWPSVFMWL